jgi:uncharacterized protein with ParB-like and HNH nuclease domain
MCFITAKNQERIAPLGPGERRLGWFVLPNFQRPPVWTLEQKIRFVESCWLGLPIGMIIYNRPERYDSPYDGWLLDGQQRVTALFEYMDDAFPIFGHLFSELTKPDHRNWSMSVSLPHAQTRIENEAELREVYDRLAYGGTPHDPALRGADQI